MLSWIIQKTVGAVSDTTDVVMAAGNMIIDDIADIPRAIEDGWKEGVVSKDTESKLEDVVEKHTPPPKFGTNTAS